MDPFDSPPLATKVGIDLAVADFAVHGHDALGRVALVRLRAQVALGREPATATYLRHVEGARRELAAAKSIVTVDGGRRIEAALRAVGLLEAHAGEFA